MRVKTKERIIAVIGLAIISMMLALFVRLLLTNPDRWMSVKW
jgi:hypothetical protein